MAVDLDFVARIAGVDPEADATVLEACRDAAVEWYAGAGVPATTEGAQYAFWVANLAAWFIDNRGNPDSSAQIPAYILASVHQLRYEEAESDAGT